MIVKTIATDHQLETRRDSPPTRPTSITEKSYLRSQFERRQKRQIELTNKMNQHQRQQARQPDSVITSHELIKRRFFEKLERRESIGAARGAIKPNEPEQVGRTHHHQQHQHPHQQPPPAGGILAAALEGGANRDATAGGGAWTAKVGAINEADAGTDADEAASLETIITNNCKSKATFVAAPAANLCGVAAQAQASQPPLDDEDSGINDDRQVDAVSTSDDHERHEQAGRAWPDQDDASASGLFEHREGAAEFAQATAGHGQHPKRQASKRDLHDGLPLDAAAEHERLRLLRLEEQQREQYANPRSRLFDNSRGSHENDHDGQRANNANHEQPAAGSLAEELAHALGSQVFAGIQSGAMGEERINLIDRSLLRGQHLIEPLLNADEPKMRPARVPNQERPQDTSDHEHQIDCDAPRRQALEVLSPIGRGGGALEEDVGSCSSSGFGASGSAGSSSASSSDGHHHREHRAHQHSHLLSADDNGPISVRGCGQNDYYRKPSAARYETSEARDCDNLQSESRTAMGEHEIAQFEIVVSGRDDANSTGPCKHSLSVGPGQAHQEDKPMLHVENHGYGSLVNGRRAATATTRNQTDKRRWPLINPGDVSSELDLYSNRQYVNLPAASPGMQDSSSSSATVGYATVQARPPAQLSRGHTAGSTNIPAAGNNGHSGSPSNRDHHNQQRHVARLDFHQPTVETRGAQLEDCGSSSSERDSTTSSANTGGFSKLPPVRLIDHHFANDLQTSKAPLRREPKSPLSARPSSQMEEESNSMQQQSKKSPSLLKRFGSLVSRAFASSNSANGCGGSNSGGDYGHGGPADAVEGSKFETDRSPLSLQVQLCQNGPCNDIPNPLEAHKSMKNAVGHPGKAHDIELPEKTDKAGRGAPQRQPSLVKVSAAGSEPRIMAQADLVILRTKHSQNNQPVSRAKNHAGAATDGEAHRCHAGPPRRDTSEFSKNYRLRPNDKLAFRVRRNSRIVTDANRRTRHAKASGRYRRSATGSPCSLFSSLDSSSLTSCSSTHDQGAASSRRRHQRSLRRTSSLSDELESLMSRSEVGSSPHIGVDQLGADLKNCDKDLAKMSTKSTQSGKQCNERDSFGGGIKTSLDTAKSRSIMRWFGATSSAGSSPAPAVANSRDDCHSIRYDPAGWECETRFDSRSQREPKSLIDQNHANSDCKLDIVEASVLRARNLNSSKKPSKELIDAREQPNSLIYTTVAKQSRPPHGDNKVRQGARKPTADDEKTSRDGNNELVVSDGKCQSLNLYQNLLRNYVKRQSSSHHHRHHHHRHHHGHHNRSHNHHHHHHGHSHHHSSGNKHSSSRHAYWTSSTAMAATRCGQSDVSNNACSCSGGRINGGSGKTHCDKSSVWGQLIKINKLDGSQVIELERASGRSWGFFVARGAINNKKGIFISRMHDSSTGNSLSGLLSIGDQILTIDNYTIEPDFDILRVNQMISKKSKILLGVKPFRG